MRAEELNPLLVQGREAALAYEDRLAAAYERALQAAGGDIAARFEQRATHHLTAAATAPTMAMVAVYPDPAEAVALAQPGGEPAEILHVTLAFLGDITPEQADAALEVVREVAATHGRLEGIVGGVASFGSPPDAEEPLYPSILLPDVPGLAELRQAVCDGLDAAGIEYATNHGWTPHLTLDYTPLPSPPQAGLLGMPLTFDRLTVARGDVPRDIPLGDSLTAAGGPPDWSAPHSDEIFDADAFVATLHTKTDPVRLAAIEAATLPALEGAGIVFDATNPFVGQVLASSGAKITNVSETTRLNVMRVIRASYEQGLSVLETAEAIRAGMKAASAARAVLIARTELAAVANGGAVAATQIVSAHTGIRYWKTWLTAPGAEHPRHEEYLGLNGQTVGLPATFTVGHYQLAYPGDPAGPPGEVCQCRCAVSMTENPGLARTAAIAASALAALPSDDAIKEDIVKPAATTSRRLEAVSAVLTAGGEPAPEGTPLVTTYDMTRGPLALRMFYEQALEAGLSRVFNEGWPTDTTSIGDDAAFREESCFGDTGLFRTDSALVLVTLEGPSLRLSIAANDRAAVNDAVLEFQGRFPFAATPTDDMVPVTFWSYGKFGPQSYSRRIAVAPWDAIEGNYTAQVRDQLEAMMDGFEPGQGGQLCLWQGPPGTGKTWALRALASEWRTWADLHYVTDPDAFFGEHADYMVEVLLRESYNYDVPEGDAPEEKWRLLVLEDTGELLSADAKEKSGQALSRLLNVVDGLIGQGLRVLVLVTTNDELEGLHPAVSRPGRCASQIEFGPLDADEAAVWLGTDKAEPGTLAELYARGKKDTADPTLTAAAVPILGDMDDQLEVAADPTVVDEIARVAAEHAPEGGYGETAWNDLSATVFWVCADWTSNDEHDAAEAAFLAIDGVENFEHESEAALPEGDGWTAVYPAEGLTADVGTVVRDERPEPHPSPAAPEVAQTTKAGQVRWTAIFAPEGKLTDDGRMFWPGAISWRELPLTLMAMVETTEGGHIGAEVSGRIDEIWRDGSLIRAAGVFDEGEYGSEIARMVGDDVLTGLSVDIAAREYEMISKSKLFDDNGNLLLDALDQPDPETEEDLWDILFDDDIVFVVTDGRIGAATVCPFPAFEDAQISLAASGAIWRMTLRGNFTIVRDEPAEEPGLTASAAGIATEQPPAEWFANPGLEELTPLTVTEDGQVLGHAAAWGVCHIGIPDSCTMAPRSLTNYAYFLTGEIDTADGTTVAVGQATLGTGHADRRLGRQAAAEHYDDTGTAICDLVVGEDEHGIWVAGAIRPDAPEARVRELRAASLSGDWRNVNGNLELVALLAVNVPGFPIPRPRALMASGDQGVLVEALLAAGIVVEEREEWTLTAEQRSRLAALSARARDGLTGLAELARG